MPKRGKKAAHRKRSLPETDLQTEAKQYKREKAEMRRAEQVDREKLITQRGIALGLPKELAGHEESGWVPGRLYLRGQISHAQLLAAKAYQKIVRDYQSAIVAPRSKNGGQASIHDLDDSEMYEVWCSDARKRFSELQYVISDACLEDRTHLPRKAIATIIDGDREAPTLINELRVALNHIDRRFTTGEKAA